MSERVSARLPAAVRRALEPSEAEFQGQVIELARLCGWLVHAERPARGLNGRWATPIQGDAGFPDLVLAHARWGIIFAELKSARGHLTAHQEAWQMVLGQNPIHLYVWRPSDWESIKALLIEGKVI